MTPSRPIKLFGTEQPVEPPVLLTAGPLTAELDSGGLRYIRLGGAEVLRGVAFLVRDKNWGTYNPAITNMKVDQSGGGFTVTYDAECSDPDQTFRFSARIEGRPNGALAFTATGMAITDVLTARCGFVVLHALEGVVGAPVTVEHTDGKIVQSTFPELIDPQCPFQHIRALTHEIAPGVRAAVRMEGDAFEMEDHRNWMDASYKTYVRPLALPWPYTIPKGETTTQSVTLTIEGKAPAAATGAGGVQVKIGGPLGHSLPKLGLAFPPEHAAAAEARAADLAALRPDHLVCHFDARKGHGAAEMAAFRDLGAALGADLVLEAVLPCQDAKGAPTGDLAVMRRDLAQVAEAAKSAGVAFTRVAVSPASDLKCTLPGSVFPPAPGWIPLMEAARAAFPGVPVGGGMFSYFTELNRKRPPAEALDFICHTGCPIVHAGDDVSMTETLEALPSQFNSTRAFAGGKPYWVFPTAVSMRDNPYGAVPAENPKNIRQAMNRVDPRERGLIGAAWYAGYLAHAARAGLDAVTLAAVAGPSGVIYAPQDHAQPWFDEAGAAVYPHYHVLAGYAALTGGVHSATCSDARSVQALAVATPLGMRVLLANLTGEAVDVSIDGLGGGAKAIVLDEDSFAAACADPGWHAKAPAQAIKGALRLAPYAVAEIA
jgi:hypothetical protein